MALFLVGIFMVFFCSKWQFSLAIWKNGPFFLIGVYVSSFLPGELLSKVLNRGTIETHASLMIFAPLKIDWIVCVSMHRSQN